MSRKIAFTSLGCDKNRVDSEVNSWEFRFQMQRVLLLQNIVYR